MDQKITWFIGHKISKIKWYKQNFYTVNSPLVGIAATGTWDEKLNQVDIWKMNLIEKTDPQLLFSLPHKGDVTDLKWLTTDNTSSRLLFSSTTGDVTLIKLMDLEDILKESVESDENTLEMDILQDSNTWRNLHNSSCTGVAIHNDKNEIITVGEDGTISILSLSEPKPKKVMKNADSGSISSVSYISSSSILTANLNGILKVWDIKDSTNRPTQILKHNQSSMLHCIAVHPNQPEYVLSGSREGCLTVWDLRNTKFPIKILKKHSSSIWEVAFHPHSPNFVFSCSNDGTMLQWDFNKSNDISHGNFTVEEENYSNSELITSPLSINSFDINPNINALICGSDDESLVINTGLFF